MLLWTTTLYKTVSLGLLLSFVFHFGQLFKVGAHVWQAFPAQSGVSILRPANLALTTRYCCDPSSSDTPGIVCCHTWRALGYEQKGHSRRRKHHFWANGAPRTLKSYTRGSLMRNSSSPLCSWRCSPQGGGCLCHLLFLSTCAPRGAYLSNNTASEYTLCTSSKMKSSLFTVDTCQI